MQGAGALAREVKELVIRYGADLAGITSVEAVDALPPVWVGWTIQEYSEKAFDVMKDGKSIVVIGYHVWDDMLETAIRKGGVWDYPGYYPLTAITLRVTHHLEAKGFKTSSYSSGSYKRMAQLAGLGSYGKNALIINPVYGPWIRLGAVLTNAEMAFDRPFDKNLCGDCDECIKACPVNALTPYRVDDARCLVGVHLTGFSGSQPKAVMDRFEPRLSEHSHLMCMACQKACRFGRRGSASHM